MFESSPSQLFWFLLGLVLMLAELVTPGFVIVFFGIGAWITALCMWIGIANSFDVQLLVFLSGSILSLVLFRKQGKKYFQGRVSGKLTDTQSMDDVRGERAMVIEDIQPNTSQGKVEFHGTSWDAEAEVVIKKGTTVEIVERMNLLLKVKPVQ
jgi:membrane protein implicated in regulation of membrane protease activity